MNSKKQITIVAVVFSSILSMVATISGLTASEVFGQNATSSNQTKAIGQQNTTNATSYAEQRAKRNSAGHVNERVIGINFKIIESVTSSRAQH